MEGRDGCESSLFFLPIGLIEVLEEEVYFLMETQSQSYEAVMDMPYSRRKRFAERKEISMRRQQNAQQNAAGRRTVGHSMR